MPPTLSRPRERASDGAPALPAGVRRYDFRQPRKLNQAQRVKLGALFCRLAARIAERLHALVGVVCETSFLGLDQVQAAAQPSADEADPVVCTLALEPGPGSLYLCWPRRIAFFLLERLLGGSGEELFIDKELSDFESSLVRKITQLVGQDLQTAWDHPGFASAACQAVLENRQALAAAVGPEILIIAGWTVRLEGQSGKLEVCIPYPLVKAWLERNDGAAPEAPVQAVAATPDGLAPALAASEVTVSVRLHSNPIRLNDFLNLQPGDCLLLGHTTQEPVGVYLNDRLKFQGRLGVRGRQLAVKLTGTAASASGPNASSGGIDHGTAR